MGKVTADVRYLFLCLLKQVFSHGGVSLRDPTRPNENRSHNRYFPGQNPEFDFEMCLLSRCQYH